MKVGEIRIRVTDESVRMDLFVNDKHISSTEGIGDILSIVEVAEKSLLDKGCDKIYSDISIRCKNIKNTKDALGSDLIDNLLSEN